MLAEEPPACDRVVLSHNDVNPSNLVDDGEHLLLLDWDTAGPNDPFYDLAAVAVFLRMDDATCLRLLAAHNGAPAAALPDRFTYDRRLVAVACGTIFVHLARHAGHTGATGETLESSASLLECYQGMRAGTLNPGTANGQWSLGLALLKASASL
jgi:aminoglycoside phosphotransferase (APT) family kinase protein